MFCPKCGAQNENGAKFCAACGGDMSGEATVSATPAANSYAPAGGFTPLEDPITEPEKPKKNLKPIILGVAAVAVIAIVIALIAGLFGGGSKYIEDPDKFMAITEDGDEVTVYYNRKEIGTYKPESNFGYTISSNLTARDKTPAYLVTIDEESVALITNKEITVIKEKMEDAWISSDAKTIVYTYTKVNKEEGTESLELYTYDVKNEKATSIDDDISDGTIKVSPDAKSVIYNKYDSEKEVSNLWLYTDGDKAKLNKEISALAVSNKAKYIYGITYDKENGERDLVIVDKEGEKSKLKSEFTGEYQLNYDYSEILFVAGETAYVSVKGGDAVSILKTDSIYTVAPQYKIAKVDTFKGQVVNTSKGYYLITDIKNGDATRLADENARYSFTLTADGKWAYFIDYEDSDNSLNRVKVTADAEAETLIEDDVQSFALTSKNKVYFVQDDELRIYNGKKNEKIASDVEGVGVTAKDLVIFESDDVIYYVKGKDKEKLGEDIQIAAVSSAYFAYVKDPDDNGCGTIMVSNGNSKFEELKKDVFVGSGVTVYVPESVRKPETDDED